MSVRRCARFFILACGIACTDGFTQPVDYPSAPVKVIVGYSAGGFTDSLARLIAQHLSTTWGQPVVVENRPSAGATVATEAVVKATPNGYTLLIADIGQLAVTPALMPNLPFDTVRDLAPITYTGDLPLFLVAHSSVPANTFAELVALVKSRPGQISIGTSGIGSIHHLNSEALKAAFGLEVLMVHYRGAAPAVPALLRGEILLSFLSMSAIGPHLGNGPIRILGVNTPKRTSLSPNTPTIAELGAAEFDYPAGIGVLAPSATPRPIIAKIATDVAASLRHGDNPKRLMQLGFEVVGGTPEHFATLIKNSVGKYAKVVKASGAKAN